MSIGLYATRLITGALHLELGLTSYQQAGRNAELDKRELGITGCLLSYNSRRPRVDILGLADKKYGPSLNFKFSWHKNGT